MRLTVALVAILVCSLAAPVGATARAGSSQRSAAADGSRLRTFMSCAALVRHARRAALRTGGGGGVAPRALRPPPVGLMPRPVAEPEGIPPPLPSAAEPATDRFSSTNVQEAGVDEPDLVKSDGSRIFAVVGAALVAIDVSGPEPRLVGSLALDGFGHELLIRGDRALVVGTTSSEPEPGPIDAPAISAPQLSGRVTQLIEVDLRDPARMRVARTLTVDGSYVSARLTAGTVRVVLSSAPRAVAAESLASVRLPPAAERARRATIRRAGLRAFVPSTVLRSAISGRTFRRGLVGCRSISRPPAFSGLDLLTVLTFDLDKGLFNIDRDAVMAGAQTVYASPRSLFVASHRFDPGLEDGSDVPPATRTEIHRFDTSTAGETEYRSSGTVPGVVLNQFSLSEHEGALRVASTEQPPWAPGPEQRESESFVTVLQERDGRLAEVGRVGGLGRGERIYAVRFLGDAGYVVTFREVDPLYTIDLSRPTEPRVRGELKILGYSAYLHPIDDDLLLGVGQDATTEGRRLGTQLSLFDVSDLGRPVRLHGRGLDPGSSSEAEFDHHAFLWWPPARLAVLPLESSGGAGGVPFAGAVGFAIRRVDGIDEIGRVAHDPRPDPVPVRRSLVVGDRLYTLSDRGIASSTLDTLAPVAFLAFPAPPSDPVVPVMPRQR